MLEVISGYLFCVLYIVTTLMVPIMLVEIGLKAYIRKCSDGLYCDSPSYIFEVIENLLGEGVILVFLFSCGSFLISLLSAWHFSIENSISYVEGFGVLLKYVYNFGTYLGFVIAAAVLLYFGSFIIKAVSNIQRKLDKLEGK